MQYGDLPKDLGYMNIEVEEMCFYQYLPIKLKGDSKILYEERLKSLDSFIGKIS